MEGVGDPGQEEIDVPGFYIPLAQYDTRFISIAASVEREPLSLSGPVRDAVAAADGDTPIYFVQTLEQAMEQNLWFYRIFGRLFLAFGLAPCGILLFLQTLLCLQAGHLFVVRLLVGGLAAAAHEHGYGQEKEERDGAREDPERREAGGVNRAVAQGQATEDGVRREADQREQCEDERPDRHRTSVAPEKDRGSQQPGAGSSSRRRDRPV